MTLIGNAIEVAGNASGDKGSIIFLAAYQQESGYTRLLMSNPDYNVVMKQPEVNKGG